MVGRVSKKPFLDWLNKYLLELYILQREVRGWNSRSRSLPMVVNFRRFRILSPGPEAGWRNKRNQNFKRKKTLNKQVAFNGTLYQEVLLFCNTAI